MSKSLSKETRVHDEGGNFDRRWLSLTLLALFLALGAREGLAAEPIIVEHELSIIDLDKTAQSNITESELIDPLINQSNVTQTVSSEVPSFKVGGVWLLNINNTQVTMMVRQTEENLFGLCKADSPEPWNGVVAGLVTGDQIDLAMAANQGSVLVCTKLEGVLEGDSIRGFFVQADSTGKAFKETFSGRRITEDPSAYTPAALEAIPPAQQPEKETASTESRFKDVKDISHNINPNIKGRYAPL